MAEAVIGVSAEARRAWVRTGVQDAAPLMLAGLLANGGSLLVTVVLAHLLDARGYGALNQLIGVFFVVSTPGSALLVAVVRRMAASGGDRLETGAWAADAQGGALWAICAFGVLVAATGPALAHALGRGDLAGVDAAALAGGVWVVLCVDRGLLQAHRSYRTLSVNLLLEGGLRTALMLGFAAAGGGVGGVAAGLLCAELGTAWHARRVAVRTWVLSELSRRGVRRARAGVRALAPALRLHGRGVGDLGAAVVALGAIALLQYVDVILIGRANPAAAGAYAAVSVACKALVFVSLVVTGYLLPEVAISCRKGGHALRQLCVAGALVGVPGAVLLIVAAVAPRGALGIFFAPRYLTAATALLPLAAAMVCLSASVLLTMYLLAVGDRRVAGLLAAGACTATVSVAVAHGVPTVTALADFAVQASLASLAALELLHVHRRRAGGSVTA